MSRLQAGTMAKLQVVREKPPYGYFLTDGVQDVLLHYTEVAGEIKQGEQVEVFLFHDTEDRLAATMRRPRLLLGETALLQVVDIHPRFGCFLDIGIGRNLLLPFRELPELKELRPVVGDELFVVLDHDKQGRMLGRLAGERELAPLAFRAPESWKNQWVEARVYKPLQEAVFVLVEGGVLGFGAIGMIHATERTELLRVGQQVKARVAFVREDGRVNLSMKPLKHVGRDQDSQIILNLLHERPNGAIPYSDQTPADIITKRFGISKGAFKRALGKLLKEGVVYQKENWTYLKQEEAAAPSQAGAAAGETQAPADGNGESSVQSGEGRSRL